MSNGSAYLRPDTALRQSCPANRHTTTLNFKLLTFNRRPATGNWQLATILVVTTLLSAAAQDNKGLKDYYAGYFPMGVAVSPQVLKGPEAELIRKHFNSLTAENAMKMGPIHPEEGRYNWAPADAIVNFAQENGMRMRGHTLCWHNQTPDWLFVDKDGKTVSKEVLLQRLKAHITEVVTRYKGKIYAWDVVNEVIDDNDSKFYRDSKWYSICGEDFIAKAFQYAHEADPDALLFYNDYNTESPGKRDRIHQMVTALIDKGVPIHGIGLQGHWSIYEPSERELRFSIDKFAALGLKVQITELDVSVYPLEHSRREPRPDEPNKFTPEMEQKQITQYGMIFRVLRNYKDSVTGVTFWNVSDKHSWLDSFPVRDRKNYPLLFDQNLQPKKAYWKVVKF
ncbi:endo-1,4-beta-xylanase [Fulvivirgaceae bacterium PWU4]|uniref:Beta-xylanase n=2 Tax=Chryseosolibacter histidini TaxID=2782349 RepID=A0AAP2DFU4_9BACT|nr:endo-1,4-beta-xylanase [Chryseosolibacter histidini]